MISKNDCLNVTSYSNIKQWDGMISLGIFWDIRGYIKANLILLLGLCSHQKTL